MAVDLYKEQRRARKALREKQRLKAEEEEKKKQQSISFIFSKEANKSKPEPTPEVKKEVQVEEKVVLSEEEQIELLRKQIQEERKKEAQRKDRDNWDVKIGDEITCFDPNLSYQLTGYRPITMTQGLDFDPAPFISTGQVFLETGNYTTYVFGSKLYADFWTEQMRRCTEGYTVGRYTITGDHYFFLNFYRLLNLKNLKKASTGRLESFPDFYAKQYEYFHYISLCEHLGKDVGALKARGVNKPALF